MPLTSPLTHPLHTFSDDPIVETVGPFILPRLYQSYDRFAGLPTSQKPKVELASGVLEAIKRCFREGRIPGQPQKIRDYVWLGIQSQMSLLINQFPPTILKVDRNHPGFFVSSYSQAITLQPRKDLKRSISPPDAFSNLLHSSHR